MLVFSTDVFVFAEDIGREAQTVRRETFGTKYADRVAVVSEDKAEKPKLDTGVTFQDVLEDRTIGPPDFLLCTPFIFFAEVCSAFFKCSWCGFLSDGWTDCNILHSYI